MNACDLTLNIAVNLGRLGRWVSEGKTERVSQFMSETEEYLVHLDKAPKSDKFKKTFEIFKRKFKKLKNNTNLDDKWAEEAFTWANILTHRAKLA